MKGLKVFQLIAILATLLVISINGQISTPCTTSMITSFTPCFNFVTGSTGNASALPSAGCCSSLKSLMSTSMDCACLVVTANVPIQLPTNRTLAISLPSACNIGGAMQCKSSGSPLPAPGPTLFGPTPPPPADAPLSPGASKAVAVAAAVQSETTEQLSPASPPVETEVPKTTTPGVRPVLTPSASTASHITLPSTLLIFIAIMSFTCY